MRFAFQHANPADLAQTPVLMKPFETMKSPPLFEISVNVIRCAAQIFPRIVSDFFFLLRPENVSEYFLILTARPGR